MRRILGGILVVFMLLAAAFPCRGAEVVDRIVAVVNDDIILKSDLDMLLRPYEEQIKTMGYPADQQRTMLFNVREDLITKMIDQKLTDQQVEKYGLTISEAEVDAAIERIKATRSMTDEELRRGLAEEGTTMEEFRERMKDQLLRTRLLDYEIKSKIVITEAEIETYYQEHAERYGADKKFHLRNIIMRIPESATEGQKAAVAKRMAAVRAKWEAGTPFEELARQYSESSLAAGGGDLGLLRLENMSPKLKTLISSTPPGTVTPVVQTDQGYQLFFVEDVVEVPPESLHTVANKIEQQLYEEKLNSKFSAWLEDLRERSHIKIVR